jgi:DNA repair photolyase
MPSAEERDDRVMACTRPVIYEHARVQKMLHYVNVWFLPFRWGANTYRGCEHDCVYCNARYTHEYLGLPTQEFAHKIIVKDNAADILDKEFSRENWRRTTVDLATVTDPYQPAECRFNITRQVLRVFLKHHNPLMLTTKSTLVLRDLDILTEIAQTGFLNVIITLPTLDETLRTRLEPNAPSVRERLQAIRTIHRQGITVGVAAIPLLPYVSDSEKDMESLVKTVAHMGADYVIADVLNLRGEARARFMKFLGSYDQDLVPRYEKLYQTSYCDMEYARALRSSARRFITEYQVDDYEKMFPSGKRRKKSARSKSTLACTMQ